MGEIIGNIDVTQVTLYVFWIFFAGLILHLRREDKREGYPMEADPSNPSEKNSRRMVGYPDVPEPKEFRMPDGTKRYAPRPEKDTRELKAKPLYPWPGSPLTPTGDPMQDGVGPASYAERDDHAELNLDGKPRILPLRVANDFYVASQDPNPVGMTVIGCDNQSVGTVADVWVDRAEPKILYFEVKLNDGMKTVLLPHNFSRIYTGKKQIKVNSITSKHFVNVPGIKSPDQITSLEEDRIMAYYGGGHLYATPSRQEPLI
ncbi:MAG: photosynthetic reaction center subunit H [Pseudomonadota bacterium]